MTDYDLSLFESDGSVLAECKKIFDEYRPIKTPEHNDVKPPKTEKPSKKRLAHQHTAPIVIRRSEVSRSRKIESSTLQMAKRLQAIKQKYNKPNINPKPKRIAHVSNVSSLMDAKKKVEEFLKEKRARTPAQTVEKGTLRVPHVPDPGLVDLPMVLEAENSKLAINVRAKYLNLMIEECSKLYKEKMDVYDRALNEELNCYTRCSILNTYRNSAMLAVNRLRKEREHKSQTPESKKENKDEFCGKKFYKNLIKWKLTQAELELNGFPLPSTCKGYAVFKDGKTFEVLEKNMKRCARCKKLYQVNIKGCCLYQEYCIYHPKDRFTYRGETKFACCKALVPADGCCSSNTHVFETGDPSKIGGFVTTFDPNGPKDKRSFEVYALDCEMVYTTCGIELARVTVVNIDCRIIYEALVKPFGKILDYNTSFSGLTEEIMANVSRSITDVQAVLLHMFNSRTLLIGHSLESDLKAMKITHGTIVDTSVLFPHKMGPPRKKALRTLASNILNKIIQNSETGHDSAEDAITCMELVKWKLREELKIR